ncbi:sperm acrosome-associated protein 5-like [Tachyglossus aculeatus]|uniref:sperm acrosome-associated protein 5-like n=1 Tax=Tachyglossus aculeatus TaxID=9261 RepID=UPI0018F45E38|nr:sperm acrosome-associated protein 5-like [Tachyglossus aculeatus]
MGGGEGGGAAAATISPSDLRRDLARGGGGRDECRGPPKTLLSGSRDPPDNFSVFVALHLVRFSAHGVRGKKARASAFTSPGHDGKGPWLGPEQGQWGRVGAPGFPQGSRLLQPVGADLGAGGARSARKAARAMGLRVDEAVVLALLLGTTAMAKIYGRCELARQLEIGGLDGFQSYSLGDWLCLAFYASGFDTAAVDHNLDGSKDYGIFQLSSSWWCENEETPTQNLCHLACKDLLNQNLLDDILCVKQVVKQPPGMNAWKDWVDNCKGQDLSLWLKDCDL